MEYVYEDTEVLNIKGLTESEKAELRNLANLQYTAPAPIKVVEKDDGTFVVTARSLNLKLEIKGKEVLYSLKANDEAVALALTADSQKQR